jgi:hypothetical protein
MKNASSRGLIRFSGIASRRRYVATHNYSVFTLVRYPSGALERGEKLFLAKSAAAAVARAAVWIQRASIGGSAPEVVAISAQRKDLAT